MLYYAAASEHLGPQTMAAMSPQHFAPRVLFTAYPFVTGVKSPQVLRHAIRLFEGRPLFVDSGLFTLYHQGALGTSVEAYAEYARRYVEVMDRANYAGIMVDLDCQNIIGHSPYVRIREEIFAPRAENCIFVWHEKSGLDGLRELLDRFPRIGFSGREMKQLGERLQLRDRRVESVALKLIEKCGGSIDSHHVHLFGTTMESMFRMPSNWTCDSVSWSAVAFWGRSHSGQLFEVADRGSKGEGLVAPPSVLREVRKQMPSMIHAYRESPEFRNRGKVRVSYVKMIAAGLYAQQLQVQKWQRAEMHAVNDTDDPRAFCKQEV